MSPTLSGAVLASIARPAETILFYEVDGLGQPVFPHNNGASVCYADGHVRWLRQSDLQPLLSQLGSATPQPPPPTQTLPASPPAPTPPAGPQDLLKTFGQARDKARAASCESNLKQLALAEMMYVQDYDSHFPRAGEYHKLIFPYVKNEMVFQCPVGGTYAMNSKLSGLELKTIAEPSRTILLFDVDASGRPAYRHDGEIALAFADAHVKLCTPEEAKAFTW
jgi:prepilin-type processing-associated H-X9-DG protein